MVNINNQTSERWVWVVPATPLLIWLMAVMTVYFLSDFNAWPIPLLYAVAALIRDITFPLTPLVGIGMLVCLFWRRRKKTLTVKRSYLFAGIALSVLDILMPLAVLAYIAFALLGGGLRF
jgi:hypothetical protein